MRFIRFIVLWLVVYAAGLTVYNATYAFTQEVLIRRFQVEPAVAILRATVPEGMRVGNGATTIQLPGVTIQILRGCDGIEAWLLLVSALAVFPIPVRRRLLGLLWGTLLVFGLNLVRIVTLSHLALKKPQWLDLAHGLVWQSLIVLAVAAFVFAWLGVAERPAAPEKKA